MGRFNFTRNHRLSGEKAIQELFQKGSSFYLYPLRILWMTQPHQDASTHKILVTVPSKNFKRAVDRNKIKRRMREGYRLNQHQLVTDKKWFIAYIYTAKEILSSEEIHKKIVQSFSKIR